MLVVELERGLRREAILVVELEVEVHLGRQDGAGVVVELQLEARLDLKGILLLNEAKSSQHKDRGIATRDWQGSNSSDMRLNLESSSVFFARKSEFGGKKYLPQISLMGYSHPRQKAYHGLKERGIMSAGAGSGTRNRSTSMNLRFRCSGIVSKKFKAISSGGSFTFA